MENAEIPYSISDTAIEALPGLLIGMTLAEVEYILWNVTNVEYLYIPETRILLIEADGEQRRDAKRKHYSIEIGVG